ncbi:hypothetical protein BAUCODRAFT_37268 [Baudoinia panamericana UAMH 10762]|uniref:Uncharacterized protein n=1 Tax=Baudoinia panamericana (strain UAMH 10762) TaxID=717646 RepID=M2N4F7_BAUPA|nr:uncharacterized protein BAUCODRAFT_37268 [Baudoinia panamericana UAMH 10762]EMC93585.1 hypothetical protein BAUCODRAFT_37268 [Baudoinia panamericana UAMH 10762]
MSCQTPSTEANLSTPPASSCVVPSKRGGTAADRPYSPVALHGANAGHEKLASGATMLLIILLVHTIAVCPCRLTIIPWRLCFEICKCRDFRPGLERRSFRGQVRSQTLPPRLSSTRVRLFAGYLDVILRDDRVSLFEYSESMDVDVELYRSVFLVRCYECGRTCVMVLSCLLHEIIKLAVSDAIFSVKRARRGKVWQIIIFAARSPY